MPFIFTRYNTGTMSVFFSVAEKGVAMINSISAPNQLITTVGNKQAFLPLMSGRIIKAVILARQGDVYTLQSGETVFFAKSQQPLSLQQMVTLQFWGQNEEEIIMKYIVTPEEKGLEDKEGRLKNLLNKLGVTSEKEVLQILELSSRIPIERDMAIRYLFDPHLLTCLMLPGQDIKSNEYNKLKISRYSNTSSGVEIWEMHLSYNSYRLGNVEAELKYIDERSLLQVWSDNLNTHFLLVENKSELERFFTVFNIVSPQQGPLFQKGDVEFVDIKV